MRIKSSKGKVRTVLCLCLGALVFVQVLVWYPVSKPDRGGGKAVTKKVTPSTGIDGLRTTGFNPDGARVLYLLLKKEGVRNVPLVTLEQKLFRAGAGVTFQDLNTVVASLGGRALTSMEPLGVFLDRGKPGILFVKNPAAERKPGCGRLQLCGGRLPDGSGVQLVDPRLGAMTRTEAELARDYLGTVLTLETVPPPGPEDVPDLAVEEIAWSFGEVTKGVRITHTFRLRNTGRRKLIINSLVATCGCAASMVRKAGAGVRPPAVFYPDLPASGWGKTPLIPDHASSLGAIPPGSAADLLLVFDTSHKGNDQTVMAKIKTNDPDEPLVKLYMEGKVIRRFTCSPFTVFFREVSSFERNTAHLTVSSTTGKPFHVSDLKTTSRFVDASLLREGAPEEARSLHHTIQVVLKPGAPAGAFSCYICFKADGYPMVVDVVARILGNMTFRPGHFAFGRVRPGEAATAQVTVTGRDAEDFQITRVEVDHPDMTVSRESLDPGSVRLTLRLRAGWTAPDIRATVTVVSNDPDQPAGVLHAFGFIRRGAVK